MDEKSFRRDMNFRTFQLGWHLVYLIPLSIVLGFYLTYEGMNTWDSFSHYLQSRWLVGSYLGWNETEIEHLKWYGPLWELILGFFSEIVLKFLNDPTWVRYSFTFALYPTTLFLLFHFLIQNKIKASTAILACALFLGNIRLAGHSVLNTKDFPFACAYLLCTLYLWHFIRKFLERTAGFLDLLLGTFIAIIPYLLRTPVILHFLIWVIFIGLNYLVLNPLPKASRYKTPLFLMTPLVGGFGMIFALWPSLWHHSQEWIASFSMMSKFFWQGTIRVFGHTYPQNQLPLWYPFAWIPVTFHPLAWAGVGVGTVFCIKDWISDKKQAWSSFKTGLGPQRSTANTLFTFLDLRTWLILFTMVGWGGVLWMRPIVYDEDRHFLFLYPSLTLLGAFGLDFLKPQWKYVLSVSSVLLSVLSFIQWGRFSYVYKSPIIGNIHADQFMGDYWGSCISSGIRAFHSHIPKGSTVVVPEVINAAILENYRLTYARYSGIPGFGPYSVVEKLPSSESFYVLSYNRMGRESEILQDVKTGRAVKLWEEKMPPGDSACLLVHYLK